MNAKIVITRVFSYIDEVRVEKIELQKGTFRLLRHSNFNENYEGLLLVFYSLYIKLNYVERTK